MIQFLLTLSCLSGVIGANTKGVLTLDSWTFDKVIGGPNTVLVKFDKEYAYGEKEDAFKEFAKMVGEMGNGARDFIIAEVGRTDYGERKNTDLHERYGVNENDYPVFKLFARGSTAPISYTDDVDVESLTRFARTEAGVWIGLAGCLEKFDKLAISFMEQNDAGKKKILSKATSAKEGVNAESMDSAKAYVRVMKKIIEKGDGFVDTEIARINKLKEGRLTDAKQQLFTRRLNVLSTFKATTVEKKKEEL